MTILEAAKTITRDQVQEWVITYFGLCQAPSFVEGFLSGN